MNIWCAELLVVWFKYLTPELYWITMRQSIWWIYGCLIDIGREMNCSSRWVVFLFVSSCRSRSHDFDLTGLKLKTNIFSRKQIQNPSLFRMTFLKINVAYVNKKQTSSCIFGEMGVLNHHPFPFWAFSYMLDFLYPLAIIDGLTQLLSRNTLQHKCTWIFWLRTFTKIAGTLNTQPILRKKCLKYF